MSYIKSLYRFLSPKFQKVFLEYKVNLKSRYRDGNDTFKRTYELINQNRNSYKELLQQFLGYRDVFTAIKTNDKESNPAEPCYNNGFLPGLDIISVYSILGIYQPKNYFEIGSGNSTKVARKSICDNKLSTKITSIDPYPRVFIDNLSDRMIRKSIEDIDLSVLDELGENDILFYDGSHMAAPNSDVTVFFLDILPRLKKGVIVQVHDIYIPYDYPQFMIDRFYNEQYLLLCWLLANPAKFTILMPSFFVSEDKELSNILAPVWNHDNLKNVERHGGSFWFRVNQ